jgi:hypothetical protein
MPTVAADPFARRGDSRSASSTYYDEDAWSSSLASCHGERRAQPQKTQWFHRHRVQAFYGKYAKQHFYVNIMKRCC